MSRLEAERIEAALGGPLPMFTATESLDCPLLTEEGRCSVYADRPALCRIWGAAVDLECPHGCRPKRRLTWEQVAALFGAIEALPGQGGGRVWLMPADWLTALGRANGLTGRDVEVYATLMRKQGRDKAAGGLTEEETALHARLMRRTALPSHEQIEAEYAWLLVERSTDAEALSGSESDPMPPHPAEMGETADGL